MALLSVLFGLAIRTLWRSDVASRKQAEGWKAIVDELRAELNRRDEQYHEDLTHKDGIIAALRREIADLKAS